MCTIKSKYHEVVSKIPNHVKLVAISKYHPEDQILSVYEEGQRLFGESHVQELERKVKVLPSDIQWHFIGHLQTNKVKYIVPYISLIEAVDSVKLMREINKQAAKIDKVINILLELHIAEEETKYGFSLDECRQMLDDGEWKDMQNIRICGIMMMASNVDDEAQIRQEFSIAADFFDEIKNDYFADDACFSEKSWGMSHDYTIACEEGSTMVRIGTSIFGERVY